MEQVSLSDLNRLYETSINQPVDLNYLVTAEAIAEEGQQKFLSLLSQSLEEPLYVLQESQLEPFLDLKQEQSTSNQEEVKTNSNSIATELSVNSPELGTLTSQVQPIMYHSSFLERKTHYGLGLEQRLDDIQFGFNDQNKPRYAYQRGLVNYVLPTNLVLTQGPKDYSKYN